jgi:probable rRNA maturation factor
MIHVQIGEPFIARVDESWLCTAAQTVLDAENHPSAELTVVIADDETLQELNRTFRGVDAPTDVLSFGGEAPDFVAAPDAADYLGDVVISYPRARAQATGHNVEAELALLVIHGVLHLLGHDHLEPDEKEAMWKRQATALEKLGLAHIQDAAPKARGL